MKKLVAVIALLGAFGAFACEDMNLLKKTVKADIFYQYAPFGKLEVSTNFIITSSENNPKELTINFKQKPYKINILFDVMTSELNDRKLVDLSYEFLNTENGKVFKNNKLVKLKNGKKTVGLYDWIHGRRMIFKFSDISKDEWSTMECPKI